MDSVGRADNGYWYVTDSCGKNGSPSRDLGDDDYHAYHVKDSGDAEYEAVWNVTRSYGIFISMIYNKCDIDIFYITNSFYFTGGI